MTDEAMRAAVKLVDALVEEDLDRAEDAALAALSRIRKARAAGSSDGDLVTDGGTEHADTDRVMVDIETLGLEPGAAILSIGACRFAPPTGVFGETFYVEIDISSCRAHGLEIDEDTLEWWRDQDSDLAPLDGHVRLPDALARFKQWAGGLDEIWANSPSFDCEILKAAYGTTDMSEPWAYDQERDVRTVRSLPVAVEIEMDGREHHALEDAVHQAREIAATLRYLRTDADTKEVSDGR